MIIPANISNGKINFSSLIKNEIEGLKSRGVEVIEYYFTNRKSVFTALKASFEIRKIIKFKSIDLIHVQTGPAFIPLFFFPLKVPTVLTLGGSDLLGYHSRNIVWKLRGKMAGLVTIISSLKARKVICVSDNLKMGLPAAIQKKTVILPRGINTDFFVPVPLEKAREALNWNKEKQYVVFAFTRQGEGVKNMPLAVETIKKYNEQFKTDVQMEIIHKKDREEVLQMLNAANALLVTSLHEGSPNIVKEAMACNLPIVTVNCGDVKKRLKGVKNSAVVPDYNAETLVKELRLILTIKDRSDGREKIFRDKIDRTHTSLVLKETYSELVNRM